MLTGSIHQAKREKQATALQALDYRLFSLLGRLSQDQHILKKLGNGGYPIQRRQNRKRQIQRMKK